MPRQCRQGDSQNKYTINKGEVRRLLNKRLFPSKTHDYITKTTKSYTTMSFTRQVCTHLKNLSKEAALIL